MASIYELDLDIPKMYLHTINKLSRSKISKVRTLQRDKQTHTQTRATEHITTLHLQVVNK